VVVRCRCLSCRVVGELKTFGSFLGGFKEKEFLRKFKEKAKTSRGGFLLILL